MVASNRPRMAARDTCSSSPQAAASMRTKPSRCGRASWASHAASRSSSPCRATACASLCTHGSSGENPGSARSRPRANRWAALAGSISQGWPIDAKVAIRRALGTASSGRSSRRPTTSRTAAMPASPVGAAAGRATQCHRLGLVLAVMRQEQVEDRGRCGKRPAATSSGQRAPLPGCRWRAWFPPRRGCGWRCPGSPAKPPPVWLPRRDFGRSP